jgi:large subunit ribosomal protein L29
VNATELRKSEVNTLESRAADLRKQLETLFMQKATGGLENPKKIMEVKRDIARVLTVLKEKTLSGESN